MNNKKILLYVGVGGFLVWATVLRRLSTLNENLEPFLASEFSWIRELFSWIRELADLAVFGGVGGLPVWFDELFCEGNDKSDGTGAKFFVISLFLSSRPLAVKLLAVRSLTVIIEESIVHYLSSPIS